MKRRTIVTGAVCVLGIASAGGTAILAQSGDAGQALALTAIPDREGAEASLEALAAYLGSKLGIDVTYVPVSSYEAAKDAFVDGEVQLAWLGGLTGLQARDAVDGSRALAQQPSGADFFSYFIANAETGLREEETFPMEIAGKRFTFGSELSTSGRLMPEYFIRQAFDETPDAVFSKVGFSSNHSATIAEVQSGAFDLGAVNYQVWNAEVASGAVDPEKVKVIWHSPTYPDYQWSIRGNVDQTFGDGMTEKVQAALLGINEEVLPDTMFSSGFVPADNEEYAPLAEVAADLGLLDN